MRVQLPCRLRVTSSNQTGRGGVCPYHAPTRSGALSPMLYRACQLLLPPKPPAACPAARRVRRSSWRIRNHLDQRSRYWLDPSVQEVQVNKSSDHIPNSALNILFGHSLKESV